jgi:protoporphyrinogen oxidase
MRIAVIGAGMSGLAVANLLLDKEHDVTVYEKEDRPGGMIKCDRVNGNLFHRTGGHVFNTKRPDVMDWFWQHFDREKEFSKALRNSSVVMDGMSNVPYPIENHMYCFPEDIQKSFISDLLNINQIGGGKPENFEEFLKGRFGQTLYNIYFQPYNYKVWRRDLKKVPLSWLEGKLPMPTVEEMIYNNMNHVEERAFVHSSFYYPNNGGSQFLADRLSKGLHIIYNANITTLNKSDDKWDINDTEYDRVIFCGNVKQLPALIAGQVDINNFIQPIEDLESHGTTAVFCEIDKNEYSWMYMPSREHESHRIICTGNFSPTNNADGKMTATIEFTDAISKEDILDNLARIPYHPRYITHHYEKYTYPIQKDNTRKMISSLKEVLEPNGMYLLGRFAEWEYYNMDVAIGAAIDLAKRYDNINL